MVSGLIFQQVFNAKAHAQGHVGSASSALPVAAMTAVALWAVPRRQRRIELWGTSIALIGALGLVVAGNLRIVNAIAGDNWGDAQADALGPGRPGFVTGHHWADYGMLGVVGAVSLLAIMLMIRNVVGKGVGGGALLANAFPPWIVPGAGIIVLAVGLVQARRRASVSTPEATDNHRKEACIETDLRPCGNRHCE